MLTDDNNVHCALIRAAFPLKAPAMAYNFDAKQNSCRSNQSDSTNYSSTGRAEHAHSWKLHFFKNYACFLHWTFPETRIVFVTHW
jgi:hypothetical protein